MNKKGQEMSVSTLVLIVIGIIVLVLLILGFSMGWQNLWAKVNIFGGQSNLDTIVQACNIAVTGNSEATYCEQFNLLKKNEYVTCDYKDVKDKLTTTLPCSDISSLKKSKCLETAKVTNYIGLKEQNDSLSALKVTYNGDNCEKIFNITQTK